MFSITLRGFHMNWLLILAAAIIALLILRGVMKAFAKFIISLLLVLVALAFLLATLPPDILDRFYGFLPRELVEIIRESLATLRGKLPLHY